MQVFLVTHQTDIDPAKVRPAEAGPGDGSRLETHLLHRPRTEPIIDARLDQYLIRFDQLAEALCFAGHLSSLATNCPMVERAATAAYHQHIR
jgi:hypothetical protein